MGMEVVANICMDKEVDSIAVDSIDLLGDPSNDLAVDCSVSVNGNANPYIQKTDEVKEFEVKECITEDVKHADDLSGDSSNDTSEFETCLVKEKTKAGIQQTEGDSKKSNTTVKPTSKSAKTKHTVPQPFALATEKRALCGTRPVGTPVAKPSHSNSSPAQLTKKTNEVVPPSIARKPLQPDNKKHPDDDDPCSVASSTAASARPIMSKPTSASAPVFRCSTRAERRKEPPPTRAKSPKLGRRKSCSDTVGLDKRKGVHARVRHSLGIYQDTTNKKDNQNPVEKESNESVLTNITEDFNEK
ncbi:hypothetical protein M8C21_029169, partial [Ambrosia artemisiifolia]